MRRDDVVVVGAGPSGVMAAIAARKRGASVTLLDEQPAVGGYLRATIGIQDGLVDELQRKRGFELAEIGLQQLYDAGVNVQLRSTAWGLFEENVLGVVNPDSSYQLKADKIILGTGSTDIAVPFPGWELAGVMTARAALIAMNIHRVLPGKRVALLGDGDDLREVTESLEAAGVTLVTHIADAGRAEAGGEGRIEWIVSGGDKHPVDAVITVHGVQPDPQLALQVLAETRYSALSGMHVPVRGGNLETTVKDVWVVGDAAGNCSTMEAALEGMVAGEAAVNGRDLDDALDRLAAIRSPERALEIEQLQSMTAR